MSHTHERLNELASHYLGALAANDLSQMPVTPDVRYTENGQTLALGKGLWATATGTVTYTLHMADPATDQAALFAVMEENNTPAILATRIKARDDAICEIESLVARWGNPLYEPDNLHVPREELVADVLETERTPRDRLIEIAELYFDAIEQDNGDIVPVDSGCNRLENGVQTTNNPERDGVGRMSVKEGLSSGFYQYITEIRDRRYPVVDEQKGIVLAIVFFEHPGNVKEVNVPGEGVIPMRPFTQKPSSAMIAEAFKIRDGSIRQIEAIVEFLPYGSRSGWQ
ncbi:MAG TPA: hypothetical protein VFY10_02680 [Dehalococcoidia bacterium]|nr:hypothetical protein [Dehalococcoidia bacterium]